jgi:carotenoid cleavage dioxygenase
VARAFPNDPYLSGHLAPIRFEADAPDLIVEGELPKDLAGVFYRNGPDPLYPPREPTYHWFDGDGMVFGFFIEDGRVSMRNRWVRTDKFLKEKAAGRKLFGQFGNPMTADPESHGTRYNTGNTNIVLHGGKLLALMEGAPAVAMGPRDLATLGEEHYGGLITTTFSAHPKVDWATGEMINFGSMIHGPMGPKQIRYDRIDRAGGVTQTEIIDVPHHTLMHTFFVTQNWVVFPVMPLDISLERMLKGGPMTAWVEGRNARFAVMPRTGTAADIRWFELPPRHMFHELNAWEEDGRIVAIVAASKRAPLFPGEDGSIPRHAETRFGLTRWTFDLTRDTGEVREDPVTDRDIQFPRPDDRLMTRPTRHGWCNLNLRNREARAEGMDGVMHIDTATGRENIFDFGKGHACGEHIFAPRLGATAEGDGYAMNLVYDYATNETELAVFDALDVAAGPLARVRIPFRVPGGFHCNYYSADSALYREAFASP